MAACVRLCWKVAMVQWLACSNAVQQLNEMDLEQTQ